MFKSNSYVFTHTDLKILVLNHEEFKHVMNVSDINGFLLRQCLVHAGQKMQHFGIFIIQFHHGDDLFEVFVVEEVQND